MTNRGSAIGNHGIGSQCQLGPDEYFVLGDNSGNSEDSRFWTTPGGPHRQLLGKPLFLHKPSQMGQRWGFGTIDWPRLGWLR